MIARLLALSLALLPLVAVGEGVRVVSQTVGTDELLLAVAGPGEVAALSHLARDPAFSGVSSEAAPFPTLAANGDAEGILRHRPTLVLFADYSRAELVAQVRRAGVRVLVFDRYESLADAHANLRLLARAIGPEAEARAEAVVADGQSRVAELRRRLAGAKPKRVIAPSTYGVIPGFRTTFQDLCDHAAAENLAASLARLEGHARPPSEQMLTWPIDFLVVTGVSLDEALAPYRDVPPYPYMAAVRERRAVLIAPYMLSCVSHLRIKGYEALARALHPEAFE